MPIPVNRTNNRGKEGMNYRKKEKEILDAVLGSSRYDSRIRPAGLHNDTSELSSLVPIRDKSEIVFNEILAYETTTQRTEHVTYGGGNHQHERGMVHFRKKKKEILDEILGQHRYDREIRPSGHFNDTSGFQCVCICVSLLSHTLNKCYSCHTILTPLLFNKNIFQCSIF